MSCRAPAGASGEQWSTGDPLGGPSARQLSVARRDEGGGVTERHFRLDIDTINPFLLKMEYAVRGPVLKKAVEIEEELKQVRLSSFRVSSRPGACASTSLRTYIATRYMIAT